LLATKGRERILRSESAKLEKNALDELDVELNLDDLNDSLLNKADQIQFTEDELAELERQEREKSVIKEGERDVRALERLEKEIEGAEQMLNEARLDEDKLLETSSLDKLEKESAFEQEESLEDIEENFGKRFMDEDMVKKDNPYGLTPFDVEEIDELLNTDQSQTK
jgi:DNA repair ATPase RecN